MSERFTNFIPTAWFRSELAAAHEGWAAGGVPRSTVIANKEGIRFSVDTPKTLFFHFLLNLLDLKKKKVKTQTPRSSKGIDRMLRKSGADGHDICHHDKAWMSVNVASLVVKPSRDRWFDRFYTCRVYSFIYFISQPEAPWQNMFCGNKSPLSMTEEVARRHCGHSSKTSGSL